MAVGTVQDRLSDLSCFYDLLSTLETKLGGVPTLSDLTKSTTPQSGVYFFFEPGEVRLESGSGSRLVRVGTHGLHAGSRSTLYGRLKQHRGKRSGGGNHRGSIFRLLVGDALIRSQQCLTCPSWGLKIDLGKAAEALKASRADIGLSEEPVEIAVSNYLRRLPVLTLSVDDDPGPKSLRGYIERNSIALLSNLDREPIDRSSPEWRGLQSSRHLVRNSGLWNQRHVDEDHDRDFFGALKSLISKM